MTAAGSISIDWARCEPRDGEFDAVALAAYAADVGARRAEVIVLHDGRTPRWAGDDYWRHLPAPDRFVRYATAVVDAVGAVGAAGSMAGIVWVPIAEPNAIAIDGYVTGARPPHHRFATGHALRAIDHLVTAHALTRSLIERRDPSATVRLDMRPYDAYELGQLYVDVLDAPGRGIGRAALREHLAARRRAWYAARPAPSWRDRVIRRVAQSIVPLEQAVPRSLAAA